MYIYVNSIQRKFRNDIHNDSKAAEVLKKEFGKKIDLLQATLNLSRIF